MGSAGDEPTGGVDVDLGVLVEQVVRNDLLDQFVGEVLTDLHHRDVLTVLAGDDHRIDPHGGVAVVLHGHL